jgi:toxin ParE1/3/4
VRALRLSALALRRLEDISGFHDAGPRVVDDILEKLVVLEPYPEIGRRGRRHGTRELVIAGTPFIVVYRLGRSSLNGVTIIHGAQRWPG